MSENIFEGMPEIPVEDIEGINKSFTDYLFFKKIKDGVREYTCSACGNSFKRGKKVLLRTLSQNDIKLSTARVGEVGTCPCCGKTLEIKNANYCDYGKLYENKNALFCCPLNENEVWFRGITFFRRFSENTCKSIFEQREFFIYKLRPGEARMWREDYMDGILYEPPTLTDAFLWNHGFFCEKEKYLLVGIYSLKKTFLKYSGYEQFIQYYMNQNISLIKYLGWYARHPQIEMLVKLGHVEIVKEMMFSNTDNKKILNWDAKKPWDLLKLTHTEYNEYVGCGKDFNLLKTYNRIGGKGIKDFKKAEEVNDFFKRNTWSGNIKHKQIITVNSLAKKEGKTAYDAVKYFKKISRSSAGACHHCPGITSEEAYNLWCDYIEMTKAVNPNLNNVPIFPHDLKKRHDELLKAKKRKQAKDKKKADEKYIAELVKKYSKFKKVDEVCESITEKYSYTNGEFSIIVPTGMEEIIKESVALNMCIHRVENGRYFDRIERRETYILFLRKNKNLKKPWYIIEVEPNGTVQQKRTTNDSQYDKDISAFTPFLREWQKVLSSKLTKSDIELAKESKRLREENFADLRKTKKQVNYGNHRGELLIDLLEKDLLEVIAG